MQQQKEIVGIVGGATWDDKRKKQQKKSKLSHKKLVVDHRETVEGDHENDNEDNVVMNYHDDAYGELNERQREHPFIVTEPGEVARGKKNGLDYLFHLYDQCRAFLIQVQNIAKERGEKCPTKVCVKGPNFGPIFVLLCFFFFLLLKINIVRFFCLLQK